MLYPGTDSLDIIDKLEGGWDLIIWDPPYMDPDNPVHEERLNHRGNKFKEDWNIKSSIRNSYHAIHKTNAVRFMYPHERYLLLHKIKQKMDPDARIVYFHSILEELPYSKLKDKELGCTHGWIKLKFTGVMTGSSCPNNIEYFKIIPKPKGRAKGMVLAKYVCYQAPTKSGSKAIIARGAAKPVQLFDDIYRHTRPKHILDPFAGYGMSIKAAYSRGIDIDAIDIDSSQNWNFINQTHLEDDF